MFDNNYVGYSGVIKPWCPTRQARLQPHVNDQMVINCNGSHHSGLMLIIVRSDQSMLKLISTKTLIITHDWSTKKTKKNKKNKKLINQRNVTYVNL